MEAGEGDDPDEAATADDGDVGSGDGAAGGLEEVTSDPVLEARRQWTQAAVEEEASSSSPPPIPLQLPQHQQEQTSSEGEEDVDDEGESPLR